ncbi:MAG: hypothetical protein LBP40_02495, partial [Campylobacteraceae bacterium]|nr:hypothetical protein [Campylobacteraceae bacterium]
KLILLGICVFSFCAGVSSEESSSVRIHYLEGTTDDYQSFYAKVLQKYIENKFPNTQPKNNYPNKYLI